MISIIITLNFCHICYICVHFIVKLPLINSDELLENLILVIISKKIVKRYIKVGYNLDVMRQSACLVLNPITVYSYGFPFNCTTVGQASDSMTAPT